jgi:hypothetical protein
MHPYEDADLKERACTSLARVQNVVDLRGRTISSHAILDKIPT